jgi:hypothetical protein
MQKTLMAAFLCSISLISCNNSFANSMMEPVSLSGFYVGGSIGYANINNMLNNDGQTPMGRFSLGYDAYCFGWNGAYGNLNMELGIQNGKLMRHSPAFNDPTGDVDLPIQTTLNPVLDLLVGIKMGFAPDCGFYGFIKGGAAYRQLQFPNGNFVNSINQISGEAQAGVGFMFSRHTRILAYYQGIYANGNVNYVGHENGWVSVTNIPTQQAGFLGFEYSI